MARTSKKAKIALRMRILSPHPKQKLGAENIFYPQAATNGVSFVVVCSLRLVRTCTSRPPIVARLCALQRFSPSFYSRFFLYKSTGSSKIAHIPQQNIAISLYNLYSLSTHQLQFINNNDQSLSASSSKSNKISISPHNSDQNLKHYVHI